MTVVAIASGAYIVLDPHEDAPWFDHSFNSPTYQNVQKFHLQDYQQQYGTIPCAS